MELKYIEAHVLFVFMDLKYIEIVGKLDVCMELKSIRIREMGFFACMELK